MGKISIASLALLAATSAQAGDLSRALAGGGTLALSPGIAQRDDKRAHLLVGVGVSVIVAEMTDSPLAGFAAGVALGVLKEAYDSTGRGQVSSDDAAATALGAMMPMMTFRW